MYGEWFNKGVIGAQFLIHVPIWVTGICILLAGISIKLMDDWLDREYDQCIGKITVASKLGKATLPYTMLILVIACSLNPPVALSLFLASYSVGMAFQFQERMPSGLPGYVEAILAIVISSLLTGVPMMGWALLIMASIQLLDDILDLQKDQKSGQWNLAWRFGVVEASLVFLILFVGSILLNAVLTSMVVIALPLITLSMEWRDPIDNPL